MKCPSCFNNQKLKEGMVCKSCGYKFALNPKEEPYISDAAFQNVIDRLSGAKTTAGPGEERQEYYFTKNQLYSQLHRAAKNKSRSNRLGCSVGIAMAVLFASVLVFAAAGIWWSPIVFVIAGIIGVIVLWTRRAKVKHENIEKIVRTYRGRHPIERLADGTRFKKLGAEGLDQEILEYAPERILIVQRDDMADMLLLNRFHFDNKTLVVSANKYPQRAFAAMQHFHEKNPDIPVQLVHDASREGLFMEEKLTGDPSWNLKGKNVTDLGLFVHDVDRLKDPVWIPDSTRGPGSPAHDPVGKKAKENVAQRFAMPVDAAPPAAMMGGLGLAMVAGMALLSNELLAYQDQYARSAAGSGGYG